MTLTITIQRPRDGLPEGQVSLTAEAVTPEGIKTEEAANGPHVERVFQRVLLDTYSYLRTG